MPSTYTTNGGIEKIATGEQSGTWGDTTNLNFDILDRITNGVGTIDLSSSGAAHTLQTLDGTLSDGMFKVLVLSGATEACTITVSPNDAQKIYFISNSSGYSCTFTQGSGSNVTIANNKNDIIYTDGAGAAGAVVSLLNAVDLSGYLVATNNLSDLSSAATALVNLGVTSTAAELNILDGVTATAAELNYNDITTLGTSEASKVLTADSNGVVTFDNGISEEYTEVTSSSNSTTCNMYDGTNFSHTLSENTTFTFSNPAASGKVSFLALRITQDASASGFTITWPGAVRWPGGTTPTLTSTAGAKDQFVFYTNDAGTNWYGFTSGLNLS